MRTLALALAALSLTACPAPPGGEGEGEEGEGEEGEGDVVGEGEGDSGEGEGDVVGEGEGDVVGEGEGEPACGEDLVNGSLIVGTEGLVVARDGTTYYSQSAAIGRRSRGGSVEEAWVFLPGADTVWGVALSPDNQTVYAASPSTGVVYVVDVARAVVDFELGGFTGPNGLTVDDDGTLFVSDFSAGAVFGIDVGADDASSTRFRVDRTLAAPNGVLVDGEDLLVLSYQSGTLSRVVGGRSGTGSSVVLLASGLGNPDGIVAADDGSFFITDNGGGEVLHVVVGNGAAVATSVANSISAPANLEFGVAPLRCDRLMVTSGEELRVLDVGHAGAPVPWR